jgi:hypothetical protein
MDSNAFDFFLERVEARGLGYLDNEGVEHIVTSLDLIKNYEKYFINSEYLSVIKNDSTWSQIIKYRAMKEGLDSSGGCYKADFPDDHKWKENIKSLFVFISIFFLTFVFISIYS